jgi:hypothetical protein
MGAAPEKRPGATRSSDGARPEHQTTSTRQREGLLFQCTHGSRAGLDVRVVAAIVAPIAGAAVRGAGERASVEQTAVGPTQNPNTLEEGQRHGAGVCRGEPFSRCRSQSSRVSDIAHSQQAAKSRNTSALSQIVPSVQVTPIPAQSGSTLHPRGSARQHAAVGDEAPRLSTSTEVLPRRLSARLLSILQ